MKITVSTIPHESHRYETIGDYTVTRENGELCLDIKVSDLKNWRMEALIIFHELAEVLMCLNDGVTMESIDEFDNQFEAQRQPGDFSEPGDHAEAPYQKQHLIATGLEKVLAAQLGVSWHDYEQVCNALPFRQHQKDSIGNPGA